ncbi:hypothetical protein HFO42_16185 [Rhizobium leguminosarum]|uniref:Uncharacterized protein n=1 Tax=Rhizobium leguminosarum TaxID=384 RepID=A0AAJ1A9J8_RHILE|nr:hypothetical protein [Rhizobium leguminosarum]MBY5534863.1 hypothetical protein [Rhizobium leguminosarum]MBY5559983.1 hypothetical protein [Rhizobium leguminosarum]MBY5596333.1 hypothetical protein [Rhizobium leguminosarum]MBY5617203.1 hypothetical protein [Rhizobium leguminosarum]MBY5629628.1 hypothetical protein [Rhizobium leguminosarum]
MQKESNDPIEDRHKLHPPEMEFEPIPPEGEDPVAAASERGKAQAGSPPKGSPATRRNQPENERVEGLPETDAAKNLATAPPAMKRD